MDRRAIGAWAMRIAGIACVVLALWLALGPVRIKVSDGVWHECGPAILGIVPNDPAGDETPLEFELGTVCIRLMIFRMGFAALAGATGVGLILLAPRVRSLVAPPRPDRG